MNANVASNMRLSAADFERVVWPIIARDLGGGEIHPVEAVSDGQFAKVLDLQAGIDAWVFDGIGLRGIASRVRYGWLQRAFTIRYQLASGRDTEYQKRVRAIEHQDCGYIIPHYTVQTYFEDAIDETPAYICATLTRDLFDYVANHDVEEDSAPGGNTFLVVRVDRMKAAGYHVHEWDPIEWDPNHCQYCLAHDPGPTCYNCGLP